MGFIACKHCKKFVRVSDNAPLNFDKCQNCGHILEYAGDEQELNFLMSGIEMPKLKYEKVCAKCHSVNPKETGMCFFCGSSEFGIQYQQDDVQTINQTLLNGLNNPNIIVKETTTSFTTMAILIKLFAVFVGLMDFLFFFLLGLQLTIGISAISDKMFLMSNPNFIMIMMLLFSSLIMSGLFVSFVLPKIDYLESFKISSMIGVIVGILHIYFSSNIPSIIIFLVLFAVTSGVGGLIGEVIIHKFSK